LAEGWLKDVLSGFGAYTQMVKGKLKAEVSG
jgi:hypothetical protein